MNTRTAGKVSGWGLILMAIVAGLSLGYAFEEIIHSIESQTFKTDDEYLSLFQVTLAGVSITIILDFIISYSLYKFFEQDHQLLSMTAAMVRVLYTFIFAGVAIQLFKNLTIWTTEKDSVIQNFEDFKFLWTSGLIVFGAHLVMIGILMRYHKIPKLLWLATIIGGISY